MSVEIIYADPDYIPSFYQALSSVASERIYIEMIEPPTYENVKKYQVGLIEKNCPVFYALNEKDQVVGWCDIGVSENPRLKHRGHLGMGLVAEYRGQGVGSRLMTQALEHSKTIGLEKVELQVYTSNEAAIALYKKMGFQEEGLIRNYRQLDGRVFDVLVMAVFL